MALKLKSAAFKNNQLKTNANAVSVVFLVPDGDDFQVGYCVKVVDKNNTARYWGGKVQSIAGDRKATARLKYQVDHCTNVPEAMDQDATAAVLPMGGKDDTTDVSVTITNPTSGDKSTVDTTGVSVLP